MAGVSTAALNFSKRLSKKGPAAYKAVASKSIINQDIRFQKELGSFLPDSHWERVGRNSELGRAYRREAVGNGNSGFGQYAKREKNIQNIVVKNGQRATAIEARKAKQAERVRVGQLKEGILDRVTTSGSGKSRLSALSQKEKNIAYHQSGTFVPEEAYQGNLIRHTNPQRGRTLDNQGSFMNDDAWRRLEDIQAKHPNVRKQMVEGQAHNARIASGRKQAEEIVRKGEALRGVSTHDTILGRLGTTAKTLINSASYNLAQEGNLKKAGIGIVQSSVAGAAFSGGMGYLQGDDPWEAAKTGAFRGALAGVGYQGFKAATHANAGSIRGNIKQMSSTSRQVYKAHTVAGQEAIKKNGMSRQLKTVLEANRNSQLAQSALFNK